MALILPLVSLAIMHFTPMMSGSDYKFRKLHINIIRMHVVQAHQRADADLFVKNDKKLAMSANRR